MSDNNNPEIEMRNIEERELIATITSYRISKSELLENRIEEPDWKEFQKRVSPEIVDALLMQQKRLKKQGLTLKIYEQDEFYKTKDEELQFIQNEKIWQDGAFRVRVLQKLTKHTLEYSRGHQVIDRWKAKSWHYYTMRQEPEEGNKLSFERRVPRTEIGWEQEYPMEQNLKKEKAKFIAQLFYWWIVTGVAIGFVSYCITSVIELFCHLEVVLYLIMAGFCGMDWVTKLFIIRQGVRFRDRWKSHKALQIIRQQWPLFCMEKFIAMTSSRLKRIFYADSMEEIGDFVSCDLSSFLKDYENVVDCETIDFWFEGMSQDDTCQYMDVRQKVLLTGDLGKRMKRKRLIVKLRFMKPLESIMSMDFYHDWYVTSVEV